MEEKTIKMAEEIADLRERQGLTFKAIAELYQISSGRASYLYQDCLRRRRLARYNEMHKRQNQMIVTVKMTLGEIVVLRRILSYYENWQFRENNRYTKGKNPLFQEPDCVIEKYLEERFLLFEKEKRRKDRESEGFREKQEA